MKSHSFRILLLLAVLATLVACKETDQGKTPKTADRGDTPPWQGAHDEFVVKGWQPGNQASWDSQMRTRVAGQNEYVRMSGSEH